MRVEDFCAYQRSIRDKVTSRRSFSAKWPWHENTLKAYDKDRLPDIDYLFALHLESGADLEELLTKRLIAGHLQPEPGSVNICKKPSKYEVETQEKVVKVNDDMMEPTILRDSTICIDESDKNIRQGGIFALKMGAFIKVRRVQFGFGDQLFLGSDNNKYPTQQLNKRQIDELNVVGRVIRVTNPL